MRCKLMYTMSMLLQYSTDLFFRCILGKERKFNTSWLSKYPWLRYSSSTDAVFCAFCSFFPTADGRDKTFQAPHFGVHDWHNLSNLISRHEQNANHATATEKTENFVSVMRGETPDIASKLSNKYALLIDKNRAILRSIIEIIILCGKQNLPLRGHTEDESTFMALINFRARTDPVLAEHLQQAPSRARYLSPNIQNEIIAILGKQISDDIVRKCNEAECFSLLADEATDSATKEQISICLRFIDNSSPARCMLREEFVAFTEAEGLRGEVLANTFLHCLRENGVDLTKLRGQGYDGASNMSGKHRGVQAVVQQQFPSATYVHCRAHVLNLCLVHSSKLPIIRNMMDTVQQIAFCFNYSAKRLKAFQEQLDETEHELDKRTKLRSLCETRWSSRSDALFTFRAALEVVVETLGVLSEDGDTKARSYKSAVENFDFIVSLVSAEHVLMTCTALSKVLQDTQLDLLIATEEAEIVISMLQNERNDDEVWDAVFQRACDLAQRLDVRPRTPRQAGRQVHRENVAADNVSQYWKRAMYLPFLDHLLQELRDRLITPQERFVAEYLIPSKLAAFDDAKSDRILHEYRGDISDPVEYENEVARWKVRWTNANTKPDTLTGTLDNTVQQLYPNIYRILSILLTMPVSTATAERSFSAMRRIKNYLRSTMGETRFSALALMHIHKDFEHNIDHAIDSFAGAANRRLALLFPQ